MIDSQIDALRTEEESRQSKRFQETIVKEKFFGFSSRDFQQN
jgi:hypothetical protein